jgi:hypothetical protein
MDLGIHDGNHPLDSSKNASILLPYLFKLPSAAFLIYSFYLCSPRLIASLIIIVLIWIFLLKFLLRLMALIMLLLLMMLMLLLLYHLQLLRNFRWNKLGRLGHVLLLLHSCSAADSITTIIATALRMWVSTYEMLLLMLDLLIMRITVIRMRWLIILVWKWHVS